MAVLLSTLIIISCVLLIIIILVQNPKGGGLSSSFGGSGTQLFGGVKKTTDFLDRGTWVLAIALVAMVLGMNIMITRGNAATAKSQESEITDQLDNTPVLPPASGAAPATNQGGGDQDLPDNVEDDN